MPITFYTVSFESYHNDWISFHQCSKNHTATQNPKMLSVISDHPEIEDMILPVGDAPLDLPTEDHFTHIVADTVLAVNEEHYSVIYLGTGEGKGKNCNLCMDLQSLHTEK